VTPKRQVTVCYLAGLAAALLVAGAANAGVRIGGIDASAYPQIQATVVGSAVSARSPVLREDGRPVVGFQARNLGRQKAVVLALDNSRSMRGAALADARAAARTFVGLKGRNDRVAVISFGHRALPLTSFSNGTADASAALGAIAVDPRTGTALYDAVVLAGRRLADQALPGRAIVLLTDGHDVSSAANLADAIDAARRAHAGVYPIAVESKGFDPSPLRRLARSTGGSYHPVGSSAQLAQVYASLASELSRTWRVSYTTAARPGETLELRATVPALGSDAAELPLAAGAGGPVPTRGPSAVVPSPLYGGVGTLALALAVALLLVLAGGMLFAAGGGARLRNRLEAHVSPALAGAKRRRAGGRPGLAQQIVRATERAFGNLRQFKSLQRLLERADLPLRASEFLFMQLGAAFALGIVFAVAGVMPVVVLIAMAAGGAAPLGYASFRARSRLKAFENQLPDLLITLAASLKAGHSFRQGIQTVVDEGRPPASDEFKRVLTETSLGRQMDEALRDMAERVGSKNLEFVMTAVTIQRQVGGSMAGLFDMVADAVRARQQFARKIRGLTAMGRMSAYVLVGLPIFLLLVLTLMNPSYMTPLYHTSTGHTLMIVAAAMIAFGSALLRKMVSFRG
jgi:tight adherence protein B